jgi:hypothetical protein
MIFVDLARSKRPCSGWKAESRIYCGGPATMAHEVTVDLGNFAISSHLDTNFVLTLSISMLLSLPDQYSGAPTAAALSNQVKAGLLWITGAGSCQFELNIGLTDSLQPGSREQLQRIIVDALETFPVSL